MKQTTSTKNDKIIEKMVVLETGGPMVTIGNTQYLQPDYLSPLPTTVCILRKKFKKIQNSIFFLIKKKRKKNRQKRKEIEF